MSVKSRRVLIVEDEESIREIFSQTLRRRRHIVDVAENGRIGFRKATTFDFDVILFDLHMPEWNGVDSIKGILKFLRTMILDIHRSSSKQTDP